ncbi:hypothetical protein [Desulfofalx alkaliphila]|uniref:hypothetical protein n=1 Tax=Desulfofalx alkaliphila TaxID=105483 RepID=UPI0004E27CC4|nr:hypothetical protein [Desulfofalx alkaliphila]
MRNFNVIKTMIRCGMGSMVIGLPYICYVFWDSKTEVFYWGLAAIFLGLALIAISVAVSHMDNTFTRLILAMGYSTLVLLQIPPVVFWLAYHGSSVSGANSPLALKAHWCLAIPHIALIVAGVLVVVSLIQGNYKRIERDNKRTVVPW